MVFMWHYLNLKYAYFHLKFMLLFKKNCFDYNSSYIVKIVLVPKNSSF